MDKLKPVAWQFKNDNGVWKDGMNENNHRENTERAGIETRDLYALPEGYAIVPVVPTEKMTAIGARAIRVNGSEDTEFEINNDAESAYRAMIKAAQEEG